MKSLRRLAYWALVVVTVFNALSAVAGGIAILATGGLDEVHTDPELG